MSTTWNIDTAAFATAGMNMATAFKQVSDSAAQAAKAMASVSNTRYPHIDQIINSMHGFEQERSSIVVTPSYREDESWYLVILECTAEAGFVRGMRGMRYVLLWRKEPIPHRGVLAGDLIMASAPSAEEIHNLCSRPQTWSSVHVRGIIDLRLETEQVNIAGKETLPYLGEWGALMCTIE